MTLPDLEGVRWVRLTFVDVLGTSNSIQLPAGRFADAVAHGETFDGSALQGRTRALESDMRLQPDPATLRRNGDLARVACTVLTPDGEPWPARSPHRPGRDAPRREPGRRAGRRMEGGGRARALPPRGRPARGPCRLLR